MRQLLKNELKWKWTEKQYSDFKQLEKQLTTQPCLAHSNRNKENIVTTD